MTLCLRFWRVNLTLYNPLQGFTTLYTSANNHQKFAEIFSLKVSVFYPIKVEGTKNRGTLLAQLLCWMTNEHNRNHKEND